MSATHIYIKSEELLNALINLAELTNQKTIDGGSDEYFETNINFFTKSFMVLMCAYLESYVKDVAQFYIQEIDKILTDTKIPANILKWAILKNRFDHKKENQFTPLKLVITEDDIDKNVSANPHKTTPFFIRLGIDLSNNEGYVEIKDTVETIVNKRNSIVHHNDAASDIGLTDIVDNAILIKNYIKILDDEILLALK